MAWTIFQASVEMCLKTNIWRHRVRMVAMDAVQRGLSSHSWCKEKEKNGCRDSFFQKIVPIIPNFTNFAS